MLVWDQTGLVFVHVRLTGGCPSSDDLGREELSGNGGSGALMFSLCRGLTVQQRFM
jgi:hypothetical protein